MSYFQNGDGSINDAIKTIGKFVNLGQYQFTTEGCDFDMNAGVMIVFDDGDCIICQGFLRVKRTNDDDFTTVSIETYMPQPDGPETKVRQVAEAIKSLPCYYDEEQYALVADNYVGANYWMTHGKKVEHLF